MLKTWEGKSNHFKLGWVKPNSISKLNIVRSRFHLRKSTLTYSQLDGMGRRSQCLGSLDLAIPKRAFFGDFLNAKKHTKNRGLAWLAWVGDTSHVLRSLASAVVEVIVN